MGCPALRKRCGRRLLHRSWTSPGPDDLTSRTTPRPDNPSTGAVGPRSRAVPRNFTGTRPKFEQLLAGSARKSFRFPHEQVRAVKHRGFLNPCRSSHKHLLIFSPIFSEVRRNLAPPSRRAACSVLHPPPTGGGSCSGPPKRARGERSVRAGSTFTPMVNPC